MRRPTLEVWLRLRRHTRQPKTEYVYGWHRMAPLSFYPGGGGTIGAGATSPGGGGPLSG